MRQTHIRVEYLTALEQDDYAALPGDVYTRGFLRNYSSVLGLDPVAVVTAYEARNDSPRRRAHAGTTPAPHRPPPPIRIQPLSPTPIDTRVRYAPSFWLMGLLAFVLLILGYLGYTTLTGIRQAQTPQATPTTVGLRTPTALNAILPTALVSSTPVLTTLPTPGPGGVVAGGPGSKLPTPASGPPPAGTPALGGTLATPGAPANTATQTALANQTATPTPGGTVAVQVTVGSQNAWMKVDIDGKPFFAGTLRAGDIRTWTGQSHVRIRFARADITSVSVNGVDKGLAGDPSQTVITKEWDPSGAERVIP